MKKDYKIADIFVYIRFFLYLCAQIMISMDKKECLVAISCFTYNHKNYLSQCLDGFVMQKTNFRYVAVVHDDCSTDGTADILREYAAKYPDIIWPIYEDENQYSKHNGEIDRKMNDAFDQLGAKHIAMCEGDDYWTDPLKLQKQVDFLEGHPDYSLCCSNTHLFDLSSNIFLDDPFEMLGKSSIEDLSKVNYIHTSSVMYRVTKSVEEKRKLIGPTIPGDYVTWLLYSEQGFIYKLPDYTAVYRINGSQSTWSGKNYFYNGLNLIQTLAKLSTYIDNPIAKINLLNYLNEQKNIIDDIYTKESLFYRKNNHRLWYRALRKIFRKLHWVVLQ